MKPYSDNAFHLAGIKFHLTPLNCESLFNLDVSYSIILFYA